MIWFLDFSGNLDGRWALLYVHTAGVEATLEFGIRLVMCLGTTEGMSLALESGIGRRETLESKASSICSISVFMSPTCFGIEKDVSPILAQQGRGMPFWETT